VIKSNLTEQQLAFLEAEGFKFANCFASKNFGLKWKHKPALELARAARKLGLKASVCRGDVTVFYPVERRE